MMILFFWILAFSGNKRNQYAYNALGNIVIESYQETWIAFWLPVAKLYGDVGLAFFTTVIYQAQSAQPVVRDAAST